MLNYRHLNLLDRLARHIGCYDINICRARTKSLDRTSQIYCEDVIDELKNVHHYDRRLEL